MNGRIQNEMRIERANEIKIANMPSYVRRWYINMKASRKTAATCRDYISKVERFLKSINPDISKVNPSDINEENVSNYFLSIQTTKKNGELTYTSDSYQCTIWSCLDNFLNYLCRSGLIKYNYIKDITKPKNHDLDRINEHRILLTSDDFKKIVKATEESKRDRAIILMFMNTGMRETALLSITLDEIDLDNSKLSIIDKGNKRHEYVINYELSKAIKEWLNERNNYLHDDNNHLFLSSRGSVMHPNTVKKVVKKYTEIAIGQPLSPHKLRSGYCSILYEKTGDIEFVRRCVGHSNATTTQRYIVTKGTEKQKAADIMENLLS